MNGYPDLRSFFIPGRQGRLFAAMYTAGGSGPHPLVMLLHGIPGNERNFDLAQDLRRAGFNTLVFHYSGNWGSDGIYSFRSDIDDASSALDWMLANAVEYAIDVKRIYAVGHSLGGTVCAHLAARRAEIRAAVLLSPCDAGNLALIDRECPENGRTIRDIFAESAPWLVGTSAEALAGECLGHGDELGIRHLGGLLSAKPVMTLAGGRDNLTPAALHLEPLEKAIEDAGGVLPEKHRIESDHFYSDARLEVAAMIREFLERN